MDVVTALFVVSAVLAAFWSSLVSILHLRGWLPKAYTARLTNIQSQVASQVGVEVENALDRVSVKQRALMEADAAAFQAQAAEQAVSAEASALKSAAMSITRGVGVEKQLKHKVDSAMAEAILGPAKPILAQFAPGLLATLEDNPQMLPMIIEHPLFQKYIAPRIAALLGQQGNLSVEGNEWNPGLGR
jgi:hypothetical protein